MFKETVSIYNRNLLKIMLIGLIVVLPVSIFCFQAIAYVFTDVSSEYSNLYAAFFIVINFTLLYPPFIRITLQDINDGDSASIKDLIIAFINDFGLIVFFTLGLYFLALWGMGLAFIPTIISLLLLVIFPLFVDQKKITSVLKQLGKILMKENIFILFDLLIIVCINLLVWTGVSLLLNSFDNNFYVYAFTRSLINVALFPLIYIYLTIKYKSERGDFYE